MDNDFENSELIIRIFFKNQDKTELVEKKTILAKNRLKNRTSISVNINLKNQFLWWIFKRKVIFVIEKMETTLIGDFKKKKNHIGKTKIDKNWKKIDFNRKSKKTK